MVFTTFLEPLGFELREAVNGQEGLATAIDWQPDLIIVDLRMPVMDGYEMTQRLRALPTFQTIPILASSANVFELNHQQSQAVGCNDFLLRPVQLSLLLNQLQHHLNLVWIYAAPQGDSDPRTSANRATLDTARAAWIVPPQSELTILYEAARAGDLDLVTQEAEQMAQQQPQYYRFAQQMLQWAGEFDVEAILNLIEDAQTD
jgi:hypothetical protein